MAANKAVCINAATMALIDAGIPMKDFVCACNASYIEDTPVVGNKCTWYKYRRLTDVLDLNYLEEGAGGADLTIAVMPKTGKIVLLQVSSSMTYCLAAGCVICDRWIIVSTLTTSRR